MFIPPEGAMQAVRKDEYRDMVRQDFFWVKKSATRECFYDSSTCTDTWQYLLYGLNEHNRKLLSQDYAEDYLPVLCSCSAEIIE